MGKYIKTATLVATLCVLALVAPGASEAGCPGSQILDATFSYLISNPDWGGIGGTGTCEYYGCYDNESGPPVSSGMKGVFWDLGNGDPVIGMGNDSGLFGGGFGPGTFWLKQASVDLTNGLYHYSAWLSLQLGYNYVVGPPVSWSFPDVDGCGPANPPETTCTCFMLSDEWNGAGYFTTLSARSDMLGNTRYNTSGETIRLAEIPRPHITSSTRNAVNADVTLQVTHAALSGGTYEDNGCGNCLGGFRVYGMIVPRGAGAPTSRARSAWVELAGGGGGAQATTPLDQTATVLADCNELANQDLYLAIGLVSEGATPFISEHVSANSTLVSCGQTLADPNGNRPRDPQPDRGRDSRPDRNRSR